MTISIWIIAGIILSVGLWYYYKKNKHKERKPEIKFEDKKNKKKFTEIDKMLSHVTANKNEENPSGGFEKNTIDNNETKTNNSGIKEKNTEIDIKEKVIGSIILERKKKK